MDCLTVIYFVATAFFGSMITVFVILWAELYHSFRDFWKSIVNKEYRDFLAVFRIGKNIRYVKNFPEDLRYVCLEKRALYQDKRGDTERTKIAKQHVRKLLQSDTLIMDYFTGQYFKYSDYQEMITALNTVEIPDEKTVIIDELKRFLRYENSAECMYAIIVDFMTGSQCKLSLGKKTFVLYHAITSCADFNGKCSPPEFLASMRKIALINDKIKVLSGKSGSVFSTYKSELEELIDKYRNAESKNKQDIIKEPLLNDYFSLKEEIDNKIRPFIK